VSSSLARSAAASLPEVRTSPMRCPGSSSIKKARGDFSPAMDPRPQQRRDSSAIPGAELWLPLWSRIGRNHPTIRTGEIEMAGRKSAAKLG
jgi:hypothetical protein